MQPEVIAAGIVGGISWAVLGLVKNRTGDNWDGFKGKKFLKSVFIGGAIGGILAYQGASVEVASIEAFASNSFLYGAITAFAEKTATLIYNGLKKIF